jgi:AraC family transcriptional regulator
VTSTPAKPADGGEPNAIRPGLRISPADVVWRRGLSRGPLTGEVIQFTQSGMLEAQFCASSHLLMAIERGERRKGETFVEGLPRSTLRSIGHTLLFVPAGRRFHDWQDPRILPRLTCLYLDPDWGGMESGLELEPRLFFYDADLWATTRKLARQIERGHGTDGLYVDALGLLLRRELIRFCGDPPAGETARHGGLAEWQVKRAADYIETHLGEQIPLAVLAATARLSPYHFTRAFKRSFGMPPHRYHTQRRIERAKSLLAQSILSITEIALEIGFGQASSFTAAFRQLVGCTPRSYRRSLPALDDERSRAGGWSSPRF